MKNNYTHHYPNLLKKQLEPINEIAIQSNSSDPDKQMVFDFFAKEFSDHDGKINLYKISDMEIEFEVIPCYHKPETGEVSTEEPRLLDISRIPRTIFKAYERLREEEYQKGRKNHEKPIKDRSRMYPVRVPVVTFPDELLDGRDHKFRWKVDEASLLKSIGFEHQVNSEPVSTGTSQLNRASITGRMGPCIAVAAGGERIGDNGKKKDGAKIRTWHIFPDNKNIKKHIKRRILQIKSVPVNDNSLGDKKIVYDALRAAEAESDHPPAQSYSFVHSATRDDGFHQVTFWPNVEPRQATLNENASNAAKQLLSSGGQTPQVVTDKSLGDKKIVYDAFRTADAESDHPSAQSYRFVQWAKQDDGVHEVTFWPNEELRQAHLNDNASNAANRLQKSEGRTLKVATKGGYQTDSGSNEVAFELRDLWRELKITPVFDKTAEKRYEVTIQERELEDEALRAEFFAIGRGKASLKFRPQNLDNPDENWIIYDENDSALLNSEGEAIMLNISREAKGMGALVAAQYDDEKKSTSLGMGIKNDHSIQVITQVVAIRPLPLSRSGIFADTPPGITPDPPGLGDSDEAALVADPRLSSSGAENLVSVMGRARSTTPPDTRSSNGRSLSLQQNNLPQGESSASPAEAAQQAGRLKNCGTRVACVLNYPMTAVVKAKERFFNRGR